MLTPATSAIWFVVANSYPSLDMINSAAFKMQSTVARARRWLGIFRGMFCRLSLFIIYLLKIPLKYIIYSRHRTILLASRKINTLFVVVGFEGPIVYILSSKDVWSYAAIRNRNRGLIGRSRSSGPLRGQIQAYASPFGASSIL